MIDDMQGIFATAADAYRAGKREGIDRAYVNALKCASIISSDNEKLGRDQAFHAAEKICGEICTARDEHRKLLAIEQERAHAEQH